MAPLAGALVAGLSLPAVTDLEVSLRDASARGDLLYAASGKLASGTFGSVRVSSSGTLRPPQ